MAIGARTHADLIERLGFSSNSTGGHMGRSMMLNEMDALVAALSVTATKDDFVRAIIDENVLGKPTLSSRKESLTRLNQIYGLDPATAVFRTLWRFGHLDPSSLPQLCLICAYSRDPQLRHSFSFIRALKPGELLVRSLMEEHLAQGFPNRFSSGMLASMARNVNTTWSFGEHLTGKVKKVRTLPQPRPITAAYAMFVGYLSGLRGEQLLGSVFADLIGANRTQLLSALSLASAQGVMSLKQAAGIVEFDFANLLTSEEQTLIHESN
ncbi:MAG: hypothetical protein ABL984_19050 [Pyrinomonadaceae bacterium]